MKAFHENRVTSQKSSKNVLVIDRLEDLALLQFGTQCVTLALGLNDTQGQSVQYHY